jgi:hypothetical protein
MAWNYRKSVKIAPGVRLNLSKRGIGYSFGVKGYRITKSASGRLSRTISIPGTGLYKRETIRTAVQNSSQRRSSRNETALKYGIYKSRPRTDEISTDQIQMLATPKIIWTLILGYMAAAAILSNFGQISPLPNKLLNILYTLLIVLAFGYRIYLHINPRKKSVQRIVVKNSINSELSKNEKS